MDLHGLDFPTVLTGFGSVTALPQLGRSWLQKTTFSSSSNAKEHEASFPSTKPIQKGNWCHFLQSSSCLQDLKGSCDDDRVTLLGNGR